MTNLFKAFSILIGMVLMIGSILLSHVVVTIMQGEPPQRLIVLSVICFLVSMGVFVYCIFGDE
jgi:hypothetical protein